MRVENILLNKSPIFCPSTETTPEKPEPPVSNVETSVYKQKGVTLPFGCWAKGQNAAEEACIKLFRKVRNGRLRQYSEPDILSFMQNMKVEQGGSRDTLEELKAILLMYKESAIMNGESSLVPNAKYMKNILNITKDRDEREFWGVMEFAKYELDTAVVRPLESIVNAKPEHRDNFIGIMAKINDEVNDPFVIRDEAKRTRIVEGLYDDLRLVMYAAEDAPTINANEKLNYISTVFEGLKFLQKKEFGSEQAKEKVLKISREILNSMIDVLKI